MRIVSVLPSATEIVCGLGAGSELVGRSEECDFPPEVAKLPVVMRARTLDRDAPSRAIDARVRASLAAGESLYELDLPLLASLGPELLLTQDLCRVCSVTDQEVASACDAAGVAPRVLSLSPTRLSEVWDSIERIAEALGRPEAGARLAAERRARTPPPNGPGGPPVAVVEWLDPPILSGLWTPELVQSGGGTPWGIAPGDLARTTDWGAIERDPPEALILSPCAFDVARTRRELRSSELGRFLAGLPIPRGVWLADEACFSRPGPRLVEGRELVRQLLGGAPPQLDVEVERWPSGAREALA